MRKLPHTAAEDLLEIIMRRYERAATLLTSNRPVDDWGKLLGDTAAVTALLDRLLHHAHVLKCGPRSWRTKLRSDLHEQATSSPPTSGSSRVAVPEPRAQLRSGLWTPPRLTRAWTALRRRPRGTPPTPA